MFSSFQTSANNQLRKQRTTEIMCIPHSPTSILFFFLSKTAPGGQPPGWMTQLSPDASHAQKMLMNGTYEAIYCLRDLVGLKDLLCSGMRG